MSVKIASKDNVKRRRSKKKFLTGRIQKEMVIVLNVIKIKVTFLLLKIL